MYNVSIFVVGRSRRNWFFVFVFLVEGYLILDKCFFFRFRFEFIVV